MKITTISPEGRRPTVPPLLSNPLSPSNPQFRRRTPQEGSNWGAARDQTPQEQLLQRLNPHAPWKLLLVLVRRLSYRASQCESPEMEDRSRKWVEEVSPPLSVIFIPTTNEYFLLGGPSGDNFRIFHNKNCSRTKTQMPTFRNFFASVYHKKVFLFGGYDGETKTQLRSG